MLSKSNIALAVLLGSYFGSAAPVRKTPGGLRKRQGDCPPLQVLYAAGTFEQGLGSTGEAFERRLTTLVPDATVEALDYSTVPEYLVTVQQGASTASDVLTAMAEDCPDGQIAMVGYSKGAMVAHETELSQDVQDRMAAVAVYGDPFERIGSDDEFPINNQGDTISFCNDGDPICSRGANIGAHLTYLIDGATDESAEFIADRVADTSAVDTSAELPEVSQEERDAVPEETPFEPFTVPEGALGRRSPSETLDKISAALAAGGRDKAAAAIDAVGAAQADADAEAAAQLEEEDAAAALAAEESASGDLELSEMSAALAEVTEAVDVDLEEDEDNEENDDEEETLALETEAADMALNMISVEVSAQATQTDDLLLQTGALESEAPLALATADALEQAAPDPAAAAGGLDFDLSALVSQLTAAFANAVDDADAEAVLAAQETEAADADVDRLESDVVSMAAQETAAAEPDLLDNDAPGLGMAQGPPAGLSTGPAAPPAMPQPPSKPLVRRATRV